MNPVDQMTDPVAASAFFRERSKKIKLARELRSYLEWAGALPEDVPVPESAQTFAELDEIVRRLSEQRDDLLSKKLHEVWRVKKVSVPVATQQSLSGDVKPALTDEQQHHIAMLSYHDD